VPVLVDSNVLLDVLTEDPRRAAWSMHALAEQGDRDVLAINPIIYAEVSIGFVRIEEIDAALPPPTFHRMALPWEAAFLAG
jgi:predicted nucleic acid-binding protein